MEEIKIEQDKRVLDDRYAWVSSMFGSILALFSSIGALGFFGAMANGVPMANDEQAIGFAVSVFVYLFSIAILVGVMGIVHILRVIEYSLRRDREKRLLLQHESERDVESD